MLRQRTRRMHTVPRSYLEAFAVQDTRGRTARVWRFDRITGEAKLVGVRDAEVAKDIYTLIDEAGNPETIIKDTILGDAEGTFCRIRDQLRGGGVPTKEDWAGLARFVALQTMRTPRMLEVTRKFTASEPETYPEDTPARVMVDLMRRWIRRIAQMNGTIARNETDLPLLTCDNPAVTWKRVGEGYQCGVNQRDASLVVSCPLAPDLILVAYQTPESLKAVLSEAPDGSRPSPNFRIHIDVGTLPRSEVERMNHVCVTNAQRHVYSSYNSDVLRQFLAATFIGKSAPGPLGKDGPPSD